MDPNTGARDRIPPGNLKSAEAYYEELAKQLTFPNQKPPASLDELMQYFGYKAEYRPFKAPARRPALG